MRIVVTGTRGIPDIPGGVETHCQELYPRIVENGHEVIVLRRTPYINDKNRVLEYKGVQIKDIFAPKRKSFEAVFHTFLAVIKAKRLHPDVLHIHAIGPSLVTPFAKLLGMKIVVTNHGPDYNRQKWGRLAKKTLILGEKLGAKYADAVIAISNDIASNLSEKYGLNDSSIIFNGVNRPFISESRSYLDQLGIIRPYIFTAGRFVKEKGFHDLINAYKISGLKERFDLVIAGDADHPDEYSEQLKELARKEGVFLTGFIKGEPLYQLMTNASLFVLPSYHEGLPITLLEAMSYGRDILASNIKANLLPELDTETDFFEVGDVNSLKNALIRKLDHPAVRSYDLSAYDWDIIAKQTISVYNKL